MSTQELIQRSQSLCQNCVWDTYPTMLTGYCLQGLACDRCKRVTDLAMVLKPEHMGEGRQGV